MLRIRLHLLCLVLALGLALAPAGAQSGGRAAPPAADLPAPTRLYPEPELFLLLRLNGDRVRVRYTPGSLDRAANLQTRLETVARGFERWTKHDLQAEIYLLRREEWDQARLPIAFGVPTRVGKNGIAAPAFGDDATVRFWAERLGGVLPVVGGVPLRGSPSEVSSLVVSDVFVQLQLSEILVDDLGIGGDAHWVRGLAAHLASITAIRRMGTDRIEDVDELYRRLAAELGPRALSVRDYDVDLPLRDWLWFQAQFHFGARSLYDKTGKDALKSLVKLRKKHGVVRGEDLRKKHKRIDEWLKASFASVSRRTE